MMSILISSNDLITENDTTDIFNKLLKKMEASGLWIGKPTPDSAAEKKFKPEINTFVQNN